LEAPLWDVGNRVVGGVMTMIVVQFRRDVARSKVSASMFKVI
jgi:hypothetical protein